MRRRGEPIESICVAAGMPTIEKATEIIEKMRAVSVPPPC